MYIEYVLNIYEFLDLFSLLRLFIFTNLLQQDDENLQEHYLI